MSYANYSFPSGVMTPHVELAQPTLLRTNSTISSNLIDIPTEPLVRTDDQNIRQLRLEIEGPQCLRLEPIPRRPAWFNRLIYALLVACLLFMLYSGVQGILLGMERSNQTAIIIWSFVAGIPALILLGIIIYPFFKAGPLQYRFDRQSNLLTIERCVGMSRERRLIGTYNLADAVGLQLLFRYYQVIQAGGIQPKHHRSNSFEMNLVFRNAALPRVNLAVHSDWKWMRQAGPRLAEFLEIPLVDQLCQS
jgi:hypothetical protein